MDIGFVMVQAGDMPITRAPVVSMPAEEVPLERITEVTEKVLVLVERTKDQVENVYYRFYGPFGREVVQSGAALAISSLFPVTSVFALPGAAYIYHKLTKTKGERGVLLMTHTQSSE